jgi:hypothetical protein
MEEDKSAKFRRLATQRGDRILKDLRLLANLSNRKNYIYTDAEIRKIFSAIDEELKSAKYSFMRNKNRNINL